MFGRLWELITSTDFWKNNIEPIIGSITQQGFASWILDMFKSIGAWMWENKGYIGAWFGSSLIGSFISPLFAVLAGIIGTFLYDKFGTMFGGGKNKIGEWFDENIKFWQTEVDENGKTITKLSKNLQEANTQFLESKVENPTIKELLLGTHKIVNILIDTKNTITEIGHSVNNIMDNSSEMWKTFKKTFIEPFKAKTLGSLIGGFRNFFNNIGNMIVPEAMEKKVFGPEREKGKEFIKEILSVTNLNEKYKNKFANGSLFNKEDFDEFVKDIQANRNNEKVNSLLEKYLGVNKKDSFSILEYEYSKFNSGQINVNKDAITEKLQELENEKIKNDNQNIEKITSTINTTSDQVKKANEGTTGAVNELDTTVKRIETSWSKFYDESNIGIGNDNLFKKERTWLESLNGQISDSNSFLYKLGSTVLNWFGVGNSSGTHDKNAIQVKLLSNDEYKSEMIPIIDQIKDAYGYNSLNSTKKIIEKRNNDNNKIIDINKIYNQQLLENSNDNEVLSLKNKIDFLQKGYRPVVYDDKGKYSRIMSDEEANASIKKYQDTLNGLILYDSTKNDKQTSLNTFKDLSGVFKDLSGKSVSFNHDWRNNNNTLESIYDNLDFSVDDHNIYQKYIDDKDNPNRKDKLLKSFKIFIKEHLIDLFRTENENIKLNNTIGGRLNIFENFSNIYDNIYEPLIDNIDLNGVENAKNVFSKLLIPIVGMNNLLRRSKQGFTAGLFNAIPFKINLTNL